MTWTERRGKYNARRTEYGGRKYDSMHEAAVAYELDMMLRAGEITEVRPQVTFDLNVHGHHVTRHRVDFLVTLKNGSQKVVEAKGMPTPEWSIKRELFIALYPNIPYEVVTQKARWYAKKKRAGADIPLRMVP